MNVVLITGASKGIGFATARHLAKSGFIVYAGCRRRNAELEAFVKDIKTLKFIILDVTEQASVDRAINRILSETNRIDVLINNAGIGVYGPTELHTIDEIRRIFETNLFGAIRMNQAVIPIMREQKRGKIINISSVAGLFPSFNLPVYSASKAGLEMIGAVDRAELAKWNIRVYMIQPGPVMTQFESNTPIACRSVSNNPYPNLEKRHEAWKALMDKGQNALHVAELIRSVIVDAAPLWNPSSEEVADKIKMQYVDPTGMKRVPLISKL